MYDFTFSYDGESGSLIRLPLAPESFKTTVEAGNETVTLSNGGEYTFLKGVKLRKFEFKVLLPSDNSLTDNRYTYHEPIFYLNKFRNYLLNKKPIRFILLRPQLDNTELFSGNLLVSLESYNVEENAGENGDFWVTLNLKEYQEINVPTISIQTNGNEEQVLVEEYSRSSKETASTYTVKSGDTLFTIAKLELNDSTKWQEIANINGITNPKTLQIGQVLKLP